MSARASPLESAFDVQVRAARLPPPIPEHRFHPQRAWRFDRAWPEKKLAVELEGATHTGGRHTRGAGFDADLEKYNEATLLGWAVLRFSAAFVRSGEALRLTRIALEQRTV